MVESGRRMNESLEKLFCGGKFVIIRDSIAHEYELFQSTKYLGLVSEEKFAVCRLLLVLCVVWKTCTAVRLRCLLLFMVNSVDSCSKNAITKARLAPELIVV